MDDKVTPISPQTAVSDEGKSAAPELDREALAKALADKSDVLVLGEGEEAAPPQPRGPEEPLIQCLAYMARHYGNPQPAEALIAGLPVGEQGLSWETFERATDRAGLTVERVARKLERLSERELPAILVMKGGNALVLTGIKKVGRKKSTYWAEVVDLAAGSPTGDTPVEHTFEDLERDYSGNAMLVRPDTEADDVIDGVTSKSPNSWFWSAFLPNLWIYRQVVLATVFINLFALTLPLFIMNVYDRVVPNNAVETLWALAIGVAVAGLLDFVLRGLRSYFVDIASQRADVTLANRIFDRVLGAGLASKGQSSGARANVLREYETLRDFFNSATLSTFGDIPFIFLFVAVIWLIAGGGIAVIPLATIPFVIGTVLIAQIPLNRLVTRSFASAAEKNSVLFETLNGLETLKSLGAESWAADKWERSVAESIRTSVKSRLISSVSLNVVVVAQVLSSVAIMVIGVAAIHDGDITAGALIAAVILSARTIAPLGQVAGVLSQLYRARLAYSALRSVMGAPQERPRKARFVYKQSLVGDIEFRGLTFTYPDEKTPAVKDISFRVKAGEKVAILGPIGSGKSTLLRLILKLYEPDSGSVLLDDIDVTHIDPAMIRGHVGYMPQNAQLFSGTIRTNISLHAPHVGDEELVRAARRSGALDWINQRSAGFDAPVGERGDGLSGGQRQSVALARAFLRNPPVLLLDEPTSDMDPMSEKVFIDQMKAETVGKTVLVVTHRPALLELVDRIIVLDRDGVHADGPKDKIMSTLMRRGGSRNAAPEPYPVETPAAATATATVATAASPAPVAEEPAPEPSSDEVPPIPGVPDTIPDDLPDPAEKGKSDSPYDEISATLAAAARAIVSGQRD